MSEYWDKTMASYGNLISYPKMDPKYLKRPPFKYILSIFIECNKVV